MESATYKNTKNYSDLAGINTWGKVVKVYDGDTFWIAIDFNNLYDTSYNANPDIKRVKIRLARVNTPEIRGGTEDGRMKGGIAKDYVSKRILDKKVLVKFDKLDKYGRSLAEIYYDLDGKLTNLSDDLLSKDLAEHY